MHAWTISLVFIALGVQVVFEVQSLGEVTDLRYTITDALASQDIHQITIQIECNNCGQRKALKVYESVYPPKPASRYRV